MSSQKGPYVGYSTHQEEYSLGWGIPGQGSGAPFGQGAGPMDPRTEAGNPNLAGGGVSLSGREEFGGGWGVS